MSIVLPLPDALEREGFETSIAGTAADAVDVGPRLNRTWSSST